MKTKIVYIVVSDETDIFLEQALLSVFSLRKHNPDAMVELVVDKATAITLTGKRGEIKNFVNYVTAIDVPETYHKGQKSRWLKTNLRNLIEGDFLYVDNDTIITDSLEAIDQFDGEIGAVRDQHTPVGLNEDKTFIRQWAQQDGWTYVDDLVYFNGGVFFVRDTEMTHDFFREWHKRWQISITNYPRMIDQSSLAATNECFQYPIKELDGVWNCQPTNGLPYIHQAKIMHYWRYHRTDYAWQFYDKSIIRRIKASGSIPEDVSVLIDQAKEAFIIPNKIIAGRELKLFYSPAFQMCLSHPAVFTFFSWIASLLSTLGRWRRQS